MNSRFLYFVEYPDGRPTRYARTSNSAFRDPESARTSVERRCAKTGRWIASWGPVPS